MIFYFSLSITIENGTEQVQRPHLQFIIDAVSEVSDSISCNIFGCRVIQRILEHCESGQVSQVLEKIIRQALVLSMDQYGNFVVQHILQYGNTYQRHVVVEPLIDHALSLSRHKFASHVMEKALSAGSASQKQRIIKTFIDYTDNSESGVLELMHCKLGNFVLQKALTIASSGMSSIHEQLNVYMFINISLYLQSNEIK